MTGRFDRYTVIFLTIILALLLIGVVGLFTGEPVAGVG